jgi:rod shape-determining protein MreD
MKMLESISQKNLRKAGSLAAPHMLLAFLFMLSLINLPLPFSGTIRPYLVLMAIYYWSIYRPTLVPPLLCFGVGILTDVVSGTPLGLNAFIMLSVHWVVKDQRRFLMGQPYTTIWAVFGLTAIACSAWQWALLGLPHAQWFSPVPGIIAILTSVFIFPFVTILLNIVHRILPVARNAYQ